MTHFTGKIVIVTGASSGLGVYLSKALTHAGATVVMAATTPDKLVSAADSLRSANATIVVIPTDVTDEASVARLVDQTVTQFGRIDAVFHCAGRSMRQPVLETSAAEFRELLELNFLGTVQVARATVPALLKTRGSLVLIGSLASKIGARYYGAYPASKFAVAAYAQQLRLEHAAQGLHVLLVCPGPIRRDEAGSRYTSSSVHLPAEALQPGGGAKTARLDPEQLSEQILRACQQRRVELIVPAKARLLCVLSALSPRLGDWLVRKFS